MEAAEARRIRFTAKKDDPPSGEQGNANPQLSEESLHTSWEPFNGHFAKSVFNLRIPLAARPMGGGHHAHGRLWLNPYSTKLNE